MSAVRGHALNEPGYDGIGRWWYAHCECGLRMHAATRLLLVQRHRDHKNDVRAASARGEGDGDG